MLKQFSNPIILAVLTFLLVSASFTFFSLGKGKWTLSIYNEGETKLRLEYQSLELCMTAGNSYLIAETAERFDCGYGCEKSSDLNISILCKKVCDQEGCRS